MAAEKGIGLHAAVSLISRQLTSADDEPVVEKEEEVLLVCLVARYTSFTLIHPIHRLTDSSEMDDTLNEPDNNKVVYTYSAHGKK